MSTSTMRALVLESAGELPWLAEVERPVPGAGEVLVRVAACGVGLTVRDKLRRIASRQLPRIPGHEVAGTVVELDADVRDLSAGDRVAAYYYLYCGNCRRCDEGRQNLCANHRGRIGEHADGGFAEFVRLPARNLVRIPDGVSDIDATVACDALGTSVHVCDRAGVGEGTRLAVVGAAGGVGIHLALLAKELGADVLGFDLGADKVRALETFGIRAHDASRPQGWRQWSGSVDVAVDFVGTAESFTHAYELLDDGGQLVRMVTYKDISRAALGLGLGVGERTVTGSRYCTVRELEHALRLLARRRVRPVVNAVEPLEGLSSIVSQLDDRTLIGRAALKL